MSRYRCEIRVKGRLTPPLASEFERLHLSTAPAPAETMVAGPVDDDAALYGLLRRMEALGLEIVEVRRIDAGSNGNGRATATEHPLSCELRAFENLELLRSEHRVTSTINTKLAVYRLQVGLDGVHRHQQLMRDLCIGHHRREMLQNRELAGRQGLDEHWELLRMEIVDELGCVSASELPRVPLHH